MAVVDHPDRLADALGQQGGMQRDHRRVFLFAAEAAARFGLDDHRLIGRQLQGALHGDVDVVRALHRAVDGYAAIRPWDGDHGLVLDVELLLVADAVLAFDHQLGLLEAGLDIALADIEMGELLRRQ